MKPPLERKTQNNITEPKRVRKGEIGNKRRQLWDVFSRLKKELRRAPVRKEALAAVESISTKANASFEFFRWRIFHGVAPAFKVPAKKKVAKPVAKKKTTPKAKKKAVKATKKKTTKKNKA